MSTNDEYVDPFEAHFQRDPMTGASVQVIVPARGEYDRAESIANGLVELLRARGRLADGLVVSIAGRGQNQVLRECLGRTEHPLVLVTSAEEPWTPDHLDPLLKAIDACDHVVGRRRRSVGGRLLRWFARIPWKSLFAVPVFDPHSPCRLHRREKLATIPLQSSTDFLDVEILAKATFFGQLIDEVPVPPLASPELWAFWHDFLEVLREPVMVHPSGPAEDPKGDEEGDDRPGGEDGEGRGDVEPTRPL